MDHLVGVLILWEQDIRSPVLRLDHLLKSSGNGDTVAKINRNKQIEMLLSSGLVREVLSHQKTKLNHADVILLNDGKTYIELSEQDYYSYHDCSTSARHIEVKQNEDEWNRYLLNYYPAHWIT
jgi:hypothetical protein